MPLKYDVIIVGGGIAGLYAALNLDDRINVLVVSKRELTLCNSALAQGGVAAVLDTTNDSFDLHFEDTMIAGGYASDPDAVRVLVSEGPDDVRRTIELGAQYDMKDGRIVSTLEGGHSRRRIVHHKDSTGDEIMRALILAVKSRKNITVWENSQLAFLDEAQNGFYAGLLTADGYKQVAGSYVILATGGIGRVYMYTTNSAIATGDGIAIAYELGAKIKNLHYVQFHPTAFAATPGRERFLISEAVRGEGAYLLNSEGKRFMDRYDERLELAPRDVVSRSIMLEERRLGKDKFYLDIRHRGADFIKDRFPMIYDRCLKEGVDITKEYIPTYPCQHYLMGGIDVDLYGRTKVDRLYAAGECSHTGVHGKNRLASNSLLEALVFGRRAAEDISRRSLSAGEIGGKAPEHKLTGAPLPQGSRTKIRKIIQRAYFVIPDMDAAESGLRQIEDIVRRLNRSHFEVNSHYCEARSLARISSIILREVVNQ